VHDALAGTHTVVAMARLGIDYKFRRASSLVDELELAVAEYTATEPFSMVTREEPSGDLATVVRVRAQPPVEWSVVIGDAVHNARSALDHLAYALVERDGGVARESTFFPITDASTGYGDRLRSGLAGASRETRDAVRALQPWKGGDDDLWKLHRLDIIDKHRLLVPVGAAHRSIGITFTLPGFPDLPESPDPIVFPPLQLRPADRQYPLQDGDEVFRVAKQARESDPDRAVQLENVAIEIAFGEGVVVEGEPLIPVLRRLVDHASSAVEHLAATV
jgi:hypothetical protein